MIKNNIKNKIINLRKRGFSINELSRKFSISKSTVSLIVRGIELNKEAKEIIKTKVDNGYKRTLKTLKSRLLRRNLDSYKNSLKNTKNFYFNENMAKILCSLIYFCEGSKGVRSGVTFINSDPNLIRTFITLFKKGFKPNLKRLRALVHLHSYHNESKQIKFWSKITGIPKRQFTKSFIKKEGGKNKKEGYQGCVSIRYRDVAVLEELLYTAKMSFSKINTIQ